MAQAQTYVLHIYGRVRKPRTALTGVVEIVRDGTWHRFLSFEELRGILDADFSRAAGADRADNSAGRARRRGA
jgi:hypothetical protein